MQIRTQTIVACERALFLRNCVLRGVVWMFVKKAID